jgi:hypothetical protein
MPYVTCCTLRIAWWTFDAASRILYQATHRPFAPPCNTPCSAPSQCVGSRPLTARLAGLLCVCAFAAAALDAHARRLHQLTSAPDFAGTAAAANKQTTASTPSSLARRALTARMHSTDLLRLCVQLRWRMCLFFQRYPWARPPRAPSATSARARARAHALAHVRAFARARARMYASTCWCVHTRVYRLFVRVRVRTRAYSYVRRPLARSRACSFARACGSVWARAYVCPVCARVFGRACKLARVSGTDASCMNQRICANDHVGLY